MKNKILKYFFTEIPSFSCLKRRIIQKQAHNQIKYFFFVRNIVPKY